MSQCRGPAGQFVPPRPAPGAGTGRRAATRWPSRVRRCGCRPRILERCSVASDIDRDPNRTSAGITSSNILKPDAVERRHRRCARRLAAADPRPITAGLNLHEARHLDDSPQTTSPQHTGPRRYRWRQPSDLVDRGTRPGRIDSSPAADGAGSPHCRPPGGRAPSADRGAGALPTGGARAPTDRDQRRYSPAPAAGTGGIYRSRTHGGSADHHGSGTEATARPATVDADGVTFSSRSTRHRGSR